MKNDSDMLEVRQVCSLTGATARQLRTWDARGLLHAVRTGEQIANNRKLFSADDVERVRDILLLRKLGLGLDDIRIILEAPDEERCEHLARHAEVLRLDYARLQKLIRLSDAAEVLGIERVRQDASLLGSYDLLASSYDRDENLRQVSRWIASHTERDVSSFADEILEVASLFAKASEQPEWHQVEMCVARFCDMWSKRFGWPSVGQMLALHLAFGEENERTSRIDEACGEGTSGFMAQAFLLAWISSALETLDDVLVHLYLAYLDEDEQINLQNIGEVLVAIACEFMGCPHIAEPAAVVRSGEHVRSVVDDFFVLVEDFALDEGIDRFLRLEDFPSIDASSMRLARELTTAYIQDELARWKQNGGDDAIRGRACEWLGDVATLWVLETGTGQDDAKAEAWLAGADDEELDERFSTWFEEWIEERYGDPPEAHWATEEESCAREKATREYIERHDSGLEVDE